MKFKNLLKINKKGFTLLEFLLYAGIIGATFVLMVGFLWNVVAGNIKETAYQEVQQNARFSMTKIIQEIKKATSINVPANPGAATSTLSLSMAANYLDPTVIDVDNGKIRITKCAGCAVQQGPYYLTSDEVRVPTLIFTNLSYPGESNVVRVEMDIEHANFGGRSEFEASVSLKSTVTLIPGGEPPLPPELVQSVYRWRNDDGGE